MIPHRILSSLVLAAAFFGAAPSAYAQFDFLGEIEKIEPYAIVSVGMTFAPNLESKSIPPFPTEFAIDGGPNAVAGAGIGSAQGMMRHEIRFDHHRGTIDALPPELALLDFPVGDPSGESFGITTITYNVGLREPFWEDRMAVFGMVGIGAATASIPLGNDLEVDGWAFAYSFTGGLHYSISDRFGLELSYRHARSTDFVKRLTPTTPPPRVNFGGGELPFGVEWSSNEVLLSLRYTWRKPD